MKLAALVAIAALVAAPAARADDGDAQVAGEPEVELAVVVTAAEGVKLGAARKATVAVSMERALRRDRRLAVLDQDDRLAARSKSIPEDAVGEARALLTTGEAMLRRGQAKPAILKLQGATTQLATVLAWTQKQDLARAQLYLGTAQAIAGDSKAAVATFVGLLAWRPEQLPDPDLEPTLVLPLWEKAQVQAKKLPQGSIEIATSPAGALAYVDGRMVGFTPTTVDGLAEGTHYVTLRRAGSVRRVEPVKVSAKAQAQAGLATMGDLLGVEQVVIVDVQPGEGQYRLYTYAVDGGARLGATDVKVGDRELEEAFAAAAVELYRQVAAAKVVIKPKKRKPAGPRGPSIVTRWWFWAGVGTVVAAGIAVPVVMKLTDGPAPITCPTGQSCGTVVFRF